MEAVKRKNEIEKRRRGEEKEQKRKKNLLGARIELARITPAECEDVKNKILSLPP